MPSGSYNAEGSSRVSSTAWPSTASYRLVRLWENATNSCSLMGQTRGRW